MKNHLMTQLPVQYVMEKQSLHQHLVKVVIVEVVVALVVKEIQQ